MLNILSTGMKVCDVYIIFIKYYTTSMYIIYGKYYLCTCVVMYKQIINLHSTNSKSFRHRFND